MEPGRGGTRATTPPSRSSRILWAQLLERIFEVLPLLCPACGGEMRIISLITLPSTVERTLLHLDLPHRPPRVSAARGPPQAGAPTRSVGPTSISPRPSTSQLPSPSRSKSSISPRLTTGTPEAQRHESSSPPPLGPSHQAGLHRPSHHPPSPDSHGATPAFSLRLLDGTPRPTRPAPSPHIQPPAAAWTARSPSYLAFLPRGRLDFPNLAHCSRASRACP